MSQQIDFEDIKWGTFTRLFKDFKKKNPNVPVKDLDDFAELVLANPEQFSNKARMKAQFYKNIIMKGGVFRTAGRKRGGAVPPSDIPHHTPTPEMRFHERRERGLQRVRETLHLIDGLRNHLENRMFDIDVIPFDDVERHQAEQLRNNLIETNNIFDAMGNDLQAVENVNANVNLDELDEMLHNIHQNLGIATHQLRIAGNFLDPFLEETEMVGQGRKRDTYKSGQERTGKSNDSIRKFFGMGRGDEDSSSSDEEEEGAGRLGDLISPSAWAEYGKAVIGGRTGLPPKVRKILEEYGDAQIIKMVACRTPVPSLLTGALNAVSFGAFEERFGKLPYDKLYHLDLRITVATKGAPVVILLEKNEVINASISPSKKKDTECVNIPIKRGLTLNKLMEGAEKVQGEKFLKYSAYNNNCQDFVMALLRGSGIENQVAFNFIKQETKSLFKDLPALRKIANTVTDIGAVANTIITGAGKKKKMPKWAKDTLLATKILKVVAPMAMGGKKSKALAGLEKFGQSIAKGTEKINPMMWAIQNEKTNKAMRQSGEATRDYALPAVVTAGMPMYYGTAGLASTATTGNPLIGVALANELWQQEGAPYQPQSKSESLNRFSEIIGKEGSKVALAKAKGAGRHLYDADVVADYLTNLRPRNRFGAPMTFEDINWYHSR